MPNDFFTGLWESLGLASIPILILTFKITATIVGAYWLLRLINFSLVKFKDLVDDKNPNIVSPAEKRAEVLSVFLMFMSRTVIWGVVVVTIVSFLDINIAPILTGAGIFSVIIGVGAQSLVKDILVGFFVLFENQYGVGDIVRLTDVTGTVEKMDLRTTNLRDINGNLHIIPNGILGRVTVMTRFWSRALLDVRVSYQQDLERVLTLLREIGADLSKEDAWKDILLEDLQVLGVEDLAEDALVIRVMVKTQPGKQWEVMRELRRRICERFNQEAIPFPKSF
jgi:moderate conductance mechanosensitive channel